MAYEGNSFGYSSSLKNSGYQPYYNYGYQTHLDYYYGYPTAQSYYPYNYGQALHGRGDETATSSRSSSPESYTEWNSTETAANFTAKTERPNTPLSFTETYLDGATSPSSKDDYFTDIKVESTATPLDIVSATLPLADTELPLTATELPRSATELTPPVSPSHAEAADIEHLSPSLSVACQDNLPATQAFVTPVVGCYQPDVQTTTNPVSLPVSAAYTAHDYTADSNYLVPSEPASRRTVKANRRGTTRNNPLPSSATDVMNAWFTSHPDHPYPTQAEKDSMIQVTGITLKQLNHWFNNRRSRSASTAPKRQKRKLEQQLASLCFDLSVSHEAGSVAEKLTSVIQDSLAPATKRKR